MTAPETIDCLQRGNMKPSEILQATKERLMEKGWTQRIYGDSEGPNCISGAFTFTVHVLNQAARLSLYDVEKYFMRSIEHDAMCSITRWNDQHDRTFGDVMAALDNAIILAKEEENSDSF